MSRMFGLLPLSFSELDIGKEGAFSFRVSDVCFLLMWISILLTFFGCNLYYAFHWVSNFPIKIKITLYAYCSFFSLTKVVIILTTNFTNSGNITKLLKKFLTIDQFIDRRSRIHMYKKIRLRILKTGAIVFLTQIMLYPIPYCVQIGGESIMILIVRNSAQNLALTFDIIFIVEYVSIVHMLKSRYEYFNGKLLEYFNKKNMATEPPYRNKNVSLNVNIDYVELPAPSGRNLTGTAWALHGRHSISYLRMIYLKMYDSVILINSYFGFPIFLETVSMTVMCVTGLYYSAYVLDFDSEVPNYMTSGYLLLCCIIFILIFTWLIVCCHKTTEEANKGIYLIHRISLDSDIHYSIKTDLDKLLSQLINMRVQFTACGLFALNPPFLCTIFSGIITYILIMVQLS